MIRNPITCPIPGEYDQHGKFWSAFERNEMMAQKIKAMRQSTLYMPTQEDKDFYSSLAIDYGKDSIHRHQQNYVTIQ